MGQPLMFHVSADRNHLKVESLPAVRTPHLPWASLTIEAATQPTAVGLYTAHTSLADTV